VTGDRLERWDRIAVIGLGQRGCELALALKSEGREVIAWDTHPRIRELAVQANVPLEDPSIRDWSGIDAVVLCRAHPSLSDFLALAELTNTPIVSDLALTARRIDARPTHCRPKLICVAGAQGVRSVAHLMTEMMRRAERDFRDVTISGLSDLRDAHPGQYRMVQMSALDMLGIEAIRPAITIVPSLGQRGDLPDGMIELLRQSEHVVMGVDSSLGHKLVSVMRGYESPGVEAVSGFKALTRGTYCLGNEVISNGPRQMSERLAVRAHDNPILGQHSRLNFAAVAAAAQKLVPDAGRRRTILSTLSTPPRRMEMVARFGKVGFVDDGLAETPQATLAAIGSLQGIFWICAGLNDGTGDQALPADLCDRVQEAYLVGPRAERLKARLFPGEVVAEFSMLREAVEQAGADANAWSTRTGKVAHVLFSPGSPYRSESVDAFAIIAREVAQQLCPRHAI
jgi:UDP-N-acetylmuramoylalanine--D-glutamate ligase